MDIKIQLFLNLVSRYKGSPKQGGYLLGGGPLVWETLCTGGGYLSEWALFI